MCHVRVASLMQLHPAPSSPCGSDGASCPSGALRLNLFTPDMTVFLRDWPVRNRRRTNKKALSILEFIYMPIHIYACLGKDSRNTRSRVLELLTPRFLIPVSECEILRPSLVLQRVAVACGM